MCGLNNNYRAKIITVMQVIALLLSIICCNSIFANDVYHTNGVTYKGVSHFKDLGEYFSFDHEGQSYSFPKHRIQRVDDNNGRNIYNLESLQAIKEGENPRSPNYIFLKNKKEVAKGKWLNAGQFLVTKGNTRNGTFKEYYDSGEIRRTFKFNGGSLNGVSEVFYRSGKVERKGVFKSGQEIGKSQLFYPNGRLKGWSIYQRGKKNGPTELYYSNRRVKAKLNFKSGRPVGSQMMFYDNGKPESKINYDDDGIKNGPVSFYYESGKLKQQGVFVNGMLHGTVTTYYESGNIKKRKVFVNGRVIQQ